VLTYFIVDLKNKHTELDLSLLLSDKSFYDDSEMMDDEEEG
jgi:hypothetical protein